MNRTIGFSSPMFVYAGESYKHCPDILEVIVPQAFLIDKNSSLSETKSQKGNTSIFINATIPALNAYATKYNYITLPVLNPLGGISKGERLIAQFVDDNPEYGFILGRC